MFRRFRLLVLVIVAALLGTGALARDIGASIEREFHVFGRTTDEGVKYNDQLDRVMARLQEATGYKLKSAKILGGKFETQRIEREKKEAEIQRVRDEQGLPPKPEWARQRDRENTDEVLNAIALPDGRVYVTLGMMRALQKGKDPDSMLAFIMGHEMTHVTERHAQGQNRRARTSGILAGILAAVVGANVNTALRVANLSANLTGTHHSRVDEYRADRGGLIAMSKAGYSTEAADDAMRLLLERYGDQDPWFAGWMSTHPLTKNRINRLQSLRQQIAAGAIPAAVPTEKELAKQDQTEEKAQEQRRKESEARAE